MLDNQKKKSSEVEVFPLHSGSQAGRGRWYTFGTLPTGCTFKGPEVCGAQCTRTSISTSESSASLLLHGTLRQPPWISLQSQPAEQ